MKNIITRVIILAAAAVAFGLQANAQTGEEYRSQVPFDFTASGRNYAAGSYLVQSLSSGSDSGAIALLERKTGNKRIIGMSRGRASGNTGKLIFLKNGNHYALVAVSTPSFVLKVKQSKPGEIARHSSEIIELALN